MPGPRLPETFIVDRHDDPSPIPSACTPAANDCSLRGAIVRANANPGFDTISFEAGIATTFQSPIVLALAGDDDAAALEYSDILDAVQIVTTARKPGGFAEEPPRASTGSSLSTPAAR